MSVFICAPCFPFFLKQYDCLVQLLHRSSLHRSSRGVKRKKHNLHSFIVASFNAQSVKGNDMACKRCEISTFIKDNGVDLFFCDRKMA